MKAVKTHVLNAVAVLPKIIISNVRVPAICPANAEHRQAVNSETTALGLRMEVGFFEFTKYSDGIRRTRPIIWNHEYAGKSQIGPISGKKDVAKKMQM
jgi:hypothetical protein